MEENSLILFCREYLFSKGKTMTSYQAVQKYFAVGAAQPVGVDGQIFVGYIVAFAGDCTYTNILESGITFTLFNTGFGNLVITDSVTFAAHEAYIIGYLCDYN